MVAVSRFLLWFRSVRAQPSGCNSTEISLEEILSQAGPSYGCLSLHGTTAFLVQMLKGYGKKNQQAHGTHPAGNEPIFSCKVIFQWCLFPVQVTGWLHELLQWLHELLCWHCGRSCWGSPSSCSWHRQACHGLLLLQAPNEAESYRPSFFNGC